MELWQLYVGFTMRPATIRPIFARQCAGCFSVPQKAACTLKSVALSCIITPIPANFVSSNHVCDYRFARRVRTFAFPHSKIGAKSRCLGAATSRNCQRILVFRLFPRTVGCGANRKIAGFALCRACRYAGGGTKPVFGYTAHRHDFALVVQSHRHRAQLRPGRRGAHRARHGGVCFRQPARQRTRTMGIAAARPHDRIRATRFPVRRTTVCRT